MDVRNKTVDIDAKSLKAKGDDGASLGDGIIAQFDAVLTTNSVDRDGDVLEPSGAVLDAKMPLLWQHSAQDPIGKYVGTVQRDGQQIVATYQIADTALGRDAVKLLKLGVLRLSHGFRPLEFEPIKGSTGYHMKKFEVVETSLVSIPANPDAKVLSLETKSFESTQFREWVEALNKGTRTMPDDNRTPVLTAEAIEKAVNDGMTKAFAGLVATAKGGDGSNADAGGGTGTKAPTFEDVLRAGAGGSKTTDVRVKSIADRYSRETIALKHFRTGETFKHANGGEVRSVSALNFAKAGAFLKRLAQKSGISVAMGEEDNALLELCWADKWAGDYNGQYEAGNIDGLRIKELLSDNVSGGISAVPFFFDVDLITYPLLSGEIFPYCDVRDVPRGSVVHAASLQTPSVTWGLAEGTDAPIYDTSNMVALISTTIQPVMCVVIVGRDFLADSPANVGAYLVETVGQRLASELDRVTASGNGTSEPLGIFNASGTVGVNAANTTSGPPTINDYMSLMFGIKKQYRTAMMRPMYISNDVSYQRSRQITVAQSTAFYSSATPTVVNQLPVLSPINDVANYITLGARHAIQNTTLGNSDILYGAMSKYRMYRRLGFEVRWISEGLELAQSNSIALIVRGRFGGQVVDANAFAVTTDAQS